MFSQLGGKSAAVTRSPVPSNRKVSKPPGEGMARQDISRIVTVSLFPIDMSPVSFHKLIVATSLNVCVLGDVVYAWATLVLLQD